MSTPEFTQTMSASGRPSRVPIRGWSVEVVGGPDKGKKATTLDALIRIGSDPACDLVLTDPTVSRRHLELERSARGLLVRDLGSRNGIYLQDRQVLSAIAQPNDTLTLGNTKLKVRQEGKRGRARPGARRSLRRAGRRLRAHAAGLLRAARRRHRGHEPPHRGRDRHRQGARRPRGARPQRAAWTGRWW